MNNKINDGGPAFPLFVPDTHTGIGSTAEQGMSLRDWFAGKALANVYTASEINPDKVAEWAYQIADAMIAARSKGPAK